MIIIFFLIVLVAVFTFGFWTIYNTLNLKKSFLLATGSAALYVLLLTVARSMSSNIGQYLARILNYGLGILLYGALVALPVLIIGAYVPKKKTILQKSYPIIVTIICISAIVAFHGPIAVEQITMDSHKVSEEISFVHITDTQLGSTSTKHFERSWKKAFAQDVDFIVFTGDLLDTDHYTAEQFTILEQSPVPIYFSYGNHEFMHGSLINSILENSSTVQLLRNELVNESGVHIIGIDYSDEQNHLQNQLNELVRKNSFSILLYHEPIDIPVAKNKGIDLMLSGHTHGGQLWPLTYIVDAIYPYGNGLFREGNLTVYTSDGVGLWGPNMRLGTQNEIALITITPEI